MIMRLACCPKNGPGNRVSSQRFHASRLGPTTTAPTAECTNHRFHPVSDLGFLSFVGLSSPHTLGNTSYVDWTGVDRPGSARLDAFRSVPGAFRSLSSGSPSEPFVCTGGWLPPPPPATEEARTISDAAALPIPARTGCLRSILSSWAVLSCIALRNGRLFGPCLEASTAAFQDVLHASLDGMLFGRSPSGSSPSPPCPLVGPILPPFPSSSSFPPPSTCVSLPWILSLSLSFALS